MEGGFELLGETKTMDAPAYQYERDPKRLPPHLQYSCRRKDVDDCLEREGLRAPFHVLRHSCFEMDHELRRPVVPTAVELAYASFRYRHERSPDHPVRRLLILPIPKEIGRSVRELFLENGLPRIIQWLEHLRKLPETALTHNLAMHVLYQVDPNQIIYRHGTTKFGSWESP